MTIVNPDSKADWDYYSIGQAVTNINESKSKLVEVLAAKEARHANEQTNQKTLDLVACIKNDCTIIQKALSPTEDLEDDFDFYDHQTFGEKKEEIKKLFKQLPVFMRDDILRELQSV